MKITIITHGIPNSHSEQANNDPLLYINYFKEKKIKFNLICIWEEKLNTSGKTKTFQTNYLKKKYKNMVDLKIIDFEMKPFERFSRFFIRIFSDKAYYFYGNKKVYKKVLNLIDKNKRQIVINFYDLPSSIFTKKMQNIKIFNFFGIHRKISEKLRIRNLKTKMSLISLIEIFNAYIYYNKVESIYKKIFNSSNLNFFAAIDTFYMVKSYKNIYFSGPLSNTYDYPKKNKTKIPVVLMIGTLKSNLMQDSLNMIASVGEKLNKINKKKNFYLRIVGKNEPSNLIKKKLNYPWVTFTGWIKNAKTEYTKATYMFVPNSIKIGTRTKIFEAAATKTCVLTTRENIIKNFHSFKHKKEMIIAKNMNEFCREFEKLLLNKSLTKKLTYNALKNYKKNHDPRKIIAKTFNKILDIYYEKNICNRT